MTGIPQKPVTDPREKHTLIINRSDSKCGNCNRGAATDQQMHDRELGYGVVGIGKPCGVEFKYVSTSYYGLEERVKSMRPDLEFIDLYGVVRG